MPSLSPRDLLDIWEQGLGRDPGDRAAALLVAACPETPREELGALSVGQRDARVLALREATFGPALEAYAQCPRCGERLEFVLATTELRRAAEPGAGPPDWTLTAESVTVRFRLPTCEDLAVASRCDSPEAARRRLIERCVLAATDGDASVGCEALPADVLACLSARMAECDPQAEVLLDLACPACDHRWPLLFDATAYLWAEIAVHARRLLREVHLLARAYGWREADVLALSAARRSYYLDLVSG